MRRVCALILLSVPWASTAWADDTHYQNVVLGERALGMAGAYTAIADDVSGAYYNPAGPAVAPSSASLSMSVYGWQRRKVERGYVDNLDNRLVSADLETSGLSTLPTTAGLVKKFGPKLGDGSKRFAVGFSTLLTSVEQNADTHVLEGPVSRGAASLSESDRTLSIGPFFGMRLTDQLSVGVSLFYTTRSVRKDRRTSNEAELPDGTSSSLRVQHASVSYSSGDLNARVGGLFQVIPEVSLGLTVGLPTLAHLTGSAKLTEETAIADLEVAPGVAVYEAKDAGGLDTKNPLPLEIRGGGAWSPGERMQFALDVAVYLPTEYDPIDLPTPDVGVPVVDIAHVATVKRDFTFNVNAGGEVWTGPVPLRFGLFTNLASSPAVETSLSNQLDHVNRYGGTFSVGYQSGDFDVSIGALYALGLGKAAVYQPGPSGGMYVPSDVREDLVLFYITGAKKALIKGVKKVI